MNITRFCALALALCAPKAALAAKQPRPPAVAAGSQASAAAKAKPAARTKSMAPESDAALLARIQKVYRGQSLTARFTQTYTDATLGKRPTESGELAIDAVGRMRFAYQQPEQKLFVYDGKVASFCEPAAAQVTTLSHFERSKAGAALAFLRGDAALQQHFKQTSSAADWAPPDPNKRVLRFVPREAMPQLRCADVAVDVPSAQIEAVIVADALNNITAYSLSDRQLGAALAPQLFVLDVPPGYSVLQGD